MRLKGPESKFCYVTCAPTSCFWIRNVWSSRWRLLPWKRNRTW